MWLVKISAHHQRNSNLYAQGRDFLTLENLVHFYHMWFQGNGGANGDCVGIIACVETSQSCSIPSIKDQPCQSPHDFIFWCCKQLTYYQRPSDFEPTTVSALVGLLIGRRFSPRSTFWFFPPQPLAISVTGLFTGCC